MIMRTEMWGVVRQLGLSATAHNLLEALIDLQKPGGEFVQSQQEIAEKIAMDTGLLSRGMKQLTATHVVLRPTPRRFVLHPLLAGYENEAQMEQAVNAALDAIADGELPAIGIPEKRRHLAAVG